MFCLYFFLNNTIINIKDAMPVSFDQNCLKSDFLTRLKQWILLP